MFCDDLGDDELTAGRVLGSVSMFNDLRMTTWKNPSGDLVTTMRGYPSNVAARRVYPFGNSSMQFVDETATTIVRQRTDEWATYPFTLANMYCVKSGSTWTTQCAVSTSAPSGMTLFDAEGFVFPSPPADRTDTTPMYLFGGTLPSGATDYVGGPDRPSGYVQVGGTLGDLLQVVDE